MSSGTPFPWKSLFLLLPLSILISGYNLYFSNQDIQIPLILWLNDPSLFPGDPFAATLGGYSSLLWPIVAVISRVVPWQVVFFAGFVLTRGLMLLAGGRLASALFPQSRLAPVAAMAALAMGPQPFLGGGTIIEVYFEHTALSVAFALLAFGELLRGRTILCAALAGLTFFLNALYGVFACTYLFAAWLHMGRWRQDGPGRIALGLLAFAALAAPAFLASLHAVGETKTSDPIFWHEAVLQRFPHHFWPGAWSAASYFFHFASSLAVACILFRRRPAEPGNERFGLAMFVVSLLWFFFALDAAYFLTEPTGVILHPARGMDLWIAFVAIYLAALCGHMFEHRSGQATWSWLPLAGFAALLAFWPLGAAGLLVGLAVAAAIAFAGRFKSTRWLSARPLTAAIAIIAFVVLVARVEERNEHQDSWFAFPRGEQLELALWARDHTEPSATFLIDPSWKSFRPLSRRPVFTTWKDGSAILWHTRFVEEWNRRLELLGAPLFLNDEPDDWEERLEDEYHDLSEFEVALIAAQVPIDYWIVTEARWGRTDWPVAFQTETYRVVRVPESPALTTAEDGATTGVSPAGSSD
ncbi:MAG: DUF6798 domain-containing protein [Sumerlaeia bacterium]